MRACLLTARRYLSSAITLRPYQEECVKESLEAIANGVTRIGISSPTGSGKTTMFTELTDRIPPRNNLATRVLILVQNIELARQASSSVARAFPHKTVEIEQGKNVASGMADVTCATIQTLTRGDRLQKFDPALYKAIIIDEAHHSAAKSYLTILKHFIPSIEVRELDEAPKSANVSEPAVLGFSATFSRQDGLTLGKVFDRIVFHKDFLEMIKEQWLCNIRFTTIHADLDLSQVKINSASGDFTPSSLASVVDTPAIGDLILKTWIDRAQNRKSTLVFAVNIQHVISLTNLFRSAGVDARYIFAGTPAQERKQLLDDFRTQQYPVLVNCAILTEGADIPNIDCVLLARPTRSRNLFSQMIGRGLRLSPGKKDCLILDVVGNTERGLVCTPTLFGLDPLEPIENSTPEELETAGSKREIIGSPTPTALEYRDYDSPEALLEALSRARHPFVEVPKMSSLAWVWCHSEKFVIEALNNGNLSVDKTSDDPEEWSVVWTAANPFYKPSGSDKAPYLKPRIIGNASTLEQAFQVGESYLKSKHAPILPQLQRFANWRLKPASEPQKLLIRKRLKLDMMEKEGWEESLLDEKPKRTKRGEDVTVKVQGRNVPLDDLKKGDAADILTKLAAGARGNVKKELIRLKKEQKLRMKEAQRMKGFEVEVGDLV